MASLTIDPSGNAVVHVTLTDGRRFPVRLGKVGRQRADRLRSFIGELEAAKLRGLELSPTCRTWAEGVTGTLRERLERAGLIDAKPTAGGLGAFIDGYLAERVDVKPGTMIVFKQARRHLVRFLGEAAPVDGITSGKVDAYRAHLMGENRAKATVAKWCSYARHFFEVAKRRGLIEVNPFEGMKGLAVKGNAARRVFVPADVVEKVIDAAPDAEWRLLIALGRYGGLRIPSEALALTWADVDFANARFIVRASKTEHHEDGGVRVVPMFPELAERFQRVFDEAEPGTEHVITRYRDPAQNLRTQFERIIKRAGVTPWAKPWQNLRVSRATELADLFPSHVCAAWLGHTEKVADGFYRMVTDEHFSRATGAGEGAAEKAVRFPVRGGGAEGRTGHTDPPLERIEPHQTVLTTVQVGAAGFEPATKGL